MENKVTCGIKNVHIAPFTEQDDGSVVYDPPFAYPGAVSIGLDPLGETNEFYADNMIYWSGAANSGYQGPFESARVPDQFRTAILGDTLSPNGLLVENVDAIPRNFAMLFEFDGDVQKRRVCLYNCSVARPSISSTTNTNTKNPNTPSMQITASPRSDGIVRVFTTDTTDQNVYDNWYTQVPEPGTSALPTLTALTIGELALSPEFSGDVTAYTAATTNASDAITASAAEGDGVVIIVNGSSIASGGNAEWREGANTVAVTVSDANGVSRTYTVTVTYTPAGG